MNRQDGGELGRGARRNAEALQDTIDHFNDKFKLLQGTGSDLSHPLDGMPQLVIDDLKRVYERLGRLLEGK